MIPVLFGILIMTFVLSRLMPGDPVLAVLPERHTPQQYRDALVELGLDQPIIIQFFRYLGDIFTGNWGESVSVAEGYPVWELVWKRFPRTMDIALFAMIIAAFVGIKTGVISATHRNKAKDTVIRGISLVGVSIPVFWLGLTLQWIFAYQIPIFPAIGFKTSGPNSDPPYLTGFRLIDSLLSGRFDLMIDYIYHLILPVLCLSFVILASITRQSRSSMLEVLEQDYIRTARAKGCKEKTVINSHALRNSLIPTVTVIGLNFGGLLGGAVLTETTFSLWGMGDLLIWAIRDIDYWLLNAIVLLTAFLFIFVNLIVDMLYAIIDPRIRY